MAAKYTKAQLLQLLSESPAYAELADGQKNLIQSHIESNNKNVLKYIFYILLEERQKYDILQERLAEKIQTIGEKVADKMASKISKLNL